MSDRDRANKGQLLVRQKKYREAALCFEAAIRLRPRSAEYYLGHAFCLQRAGLPNEARRVLLKALSAYNYRMAKSPHWARLNRALVLNLLGRERPARKELESLEVQASDDSIRKMARDMLKIMAEAQHDDPWAILGSDR